MANAASNLHDLYADWRARASNASPNQSLYTVLKVHEKQGATEFRRAFRLITELDDLLTRFELEKRNVSVYRKHLDGWARVPLMPGAAWGATPDPNAVVSEVILDQLQGFDAYLEGKVLTFDDARVPTLRQVVSQAHSALTEDEELPPEMAGYLRRLLQEIDLALDDESRGAGFDLAEAVQRLWVALTAAAEQSDSEERKQRWRGIAQQIVVGAVSSGAVEAAKIALQLTAGT